MAKPGFRSITVRERAFALAQKNAEKEKLSVAEVVERAVDRYVNTTNEAEEKIRKAITIMREQGII